MSSSNRLADLQRDIEVMLGVLSLKTDGDLNYGEAQLHLLQHKLRSLPGETPSGKVEALRLEFYSLLEDQPKLNKAYLVACHTDLLDIVAERLQYFVDWSKERKLTQKEERQRRRLEAELVKAKDSLETALREAQE